MTPEEYAEDEWFFSLPKEQRSVFWRGWECYYDRGPMIRFMDSDQNVAEFPRPCKFCNQFNIEDGVQSYDACLGKLPGVIAACCGHGAKEGYILFDNLKRVTLSRLTPEIWDFNEQATPKAR
jgi:hypothetical protein